MNDTGFNHINADSINYLATKSSIEMQNATPTELVLYYDAPAVKANLESTILDINGQKITSVSELANMLHKFSPGDNITLTVLDKNNDPYNRDIMLGQNPNNQSLAWLGIGFSPIQNQGVINQFYNTLSSFNRDHIYYASGIGDAGIFIYDLLWWLVIINVSVALINMLPMGIFDGGRFFYLTIWAITKNENIAKKAFKFATYFFLFLLFVVMFFWIFYIR
jgi:membrane-associated protease RseP (regulator of RpoE activity)